MFAANSVTARPVILRDGSSIITFGPENHYYYMMGEIAWLQFCLGHYAAAKDAFEVLIKVDPEHCPAEVKEAVTAIDDATQGRQSPPVLNESDMRWNLKSLMRIAPADENNPEDVIRYVNAVLNNLPQSVHRADDTGVYLPLIRKAGRKHPDALRKAMQEQSRRTNIEILRHAVYGLEHGQEEPPTQPMQVESRVSSKREAASGTSLPEPVAGHDSIRRREPTEAAMANAEANYFVMHLLKTQALDLVEKDVHSHETSVNIPTNSTDLTYPLEATTVIYYESNTNSVTYYRLKKAGKTNNFWEAMDTLRETESRPGWTVESGWTVENGSTNIVRNLPTAEIQRWASGQGIGIAWSLDYPLDKVSGKIKEK